MLVDAAVALAGDGRTDAVVDRKGPVAFALGLAQRTEGIDGFAGLADGHH